MTTDQISILALVTSVVSLLVSIATVYGDRHHLRAHAVPVEDDDGTYMLHVTVSNAGKRPISINHILLRPPGRSHPGVYTNFIAVGGNRVDVGESRACALRPGSLPISWRSSDELRRLSVFVLDAVGKIHRVRWVGDQGRIEKLRQLILHV